MYRKKQLKWVYDKINSGKPIEKDAYDVDQLQAMQWCDEIWSEMQKTAVIKSCFCHTGIIFRGVDQSSRAKKTVPPHSFALLLQILLLAHCFCSGTLLMRAKQALSPLGRRW
ncbi:hypothetical protein DVH05_008498 [Phytophthora capsici]|nr:hypothetical protein DVH05_008498 [Phytophthora capsici]